MTQAPVRVAMSTTAGGLNRRAKVMPSHRISRPSASVFSTSIVLPDIEVTMSPGFVARPLGMFSQVGITPTTFNFAPMLASDLIAPNTLAAPDMSNFISSMPGGCFSEMPPVSNVMPLPTSATGASPARRRDIRER